MLRWIINTVIFGSLLHSFCYCQSYKALFIGNSYTSANNLPQSINQLANSNGDTLQFDSYTPGGYTLESHSANTTTLSKISEMEWDYVILQEQSQRPSFPPSQVENEVYPYATILCDSIIANNSCTQALFFMTWGRKYGDQTNCQYYPPICTYEGMQLRLRTSYLQMSMDNSAAVAPAGMAWRSSIASDSTLELFSGDGSHPNINGTYLTACVFYAVIFRKSPIGLDTLALSQTTAQYLQQIAHETVFDSLLYWIQYSEIPYADFDYTNSTTTVSFNDLSVNASSYLWNLDIGVTETVVSPEYSFPDYGNYPVSLTVNSSCAEHTKTDTVVIENISQLRMPAISDTFKIYNDQESVIILIENDNLLIKDYYLLINDLSGAIIASEMIRNKKTRVKLDRGIYLISVTLDSRPVFSEKTILF